MKRTVKYHCKLYPPVTYKLGERFLVRISKSAKSVFKTLTFIRELYGKPTFELGGTKLQLAEKIPLGFLLIILQVRLVNQNSRKGYVFKEDIINPCFTFHYFTWTM